MHQRRASRRVTRRLCDFNKGREFATNGDLWGADRGVSALSRLVAAERAMPEREAQLYIYGLAMGD